ncbi:sporulation integral membrane protein YtvI [Bacillus shivajii]|uniref:sporulation integral membrane protein YtvI n=1 Tax=Bacillus shivajii TaxID=1983719 RepID=UPI001CFB8CA5|nr:sporulation integral membrane protein YtvI [Bacillus shivajii]UCZ52258.1 sporulation integral membrane protein YtvI [Bacillus shivajii]
MLNSFSLTHLYRLTIVVLTTVTLLLTIYLFVTYMFPFFIGLLCSFIFLPIVNFLERTFHWKRPAAVFGVMITFVLFFLSVVTFIVAEMIAGLSYLTKELPFYIHEGVELLHQWFDRVILPLYENFLALTSQLSSDQQTTLHHSLENVFQDVGTQVGLILQQLLNSFADLLMALPNAMTVFFFALLASFFITKDWPKMVGWFESHTPKRVQRLFNKLVEQWKEAIVGYVFAQLTLVTMTGIIVLIGLWIIGVKYALTTALLIAIVDLLPYLGTGLVFIPWIIYAFFTGEFGLAIGLSLLYGVAVVQRQLAEPKVMSQHMGISPLALLATLFACYQLFGVVGLLLGPALLIIVQSFIRARIFPEIQDYIVNGPTVK